MARTKRKPKPVAQSPDLQTVEALRRQGFTVECEETMAAGVRRYSVRDQSPIDRMAMKRGDKEPLIDSSQYEAAKKVAKLWKRTRVTSALKAQNYGGAGAGTDGEESENDAIALIQAKAELHGAFQALTNMEVSAVMGVVLLEATPFDWASSYGIRRADGPQVVVSALEKIAILWRM